MKRHIPALHGVLIAWFFYSYKGDGEIYSLLMGLMNILLLFLWGAMRRNEP